MSPPRTQSLAGATPGHMTPMFGGGATAKPPVRRCAGKTCVAILSRYNPDSICQPCGRRMREEALERGEAARREHANAQRVFLLLPATIVDIERALNIGHENAVKMITRLRAEGLVTRSGSPHKGCGYLYEATDGPEREA